MFKCFWHQHVLAMGHCRQARAWKRIAMIIPCLYIRLCRGADDGVLLVCAAATAQRESQVLPSLMIPVAAPATEHQYVCLKLLDQHKQLLACWSNGQQQQGRQQAGQQQSHNSSSSNVSLEYQQLDLAGGSQQQVMVGHLQRQVIQQELWVSLPAPGTYYIHVSL